MSERIVRTAYLAGGIEYAPDGGREWRREIAAWLEARLGHRSHDPSTLEHDQLSDEERRHFREWKRDDLPRFQNAVRKIIHHDLRLLLEHSDYVICRWCSGTRMGGGTHGEMTMAYWHQIPIHLVLAVPREDVSSWIMGCATEVHEDWDSLKQALERRHGVVAP